LPVSPTSFAILFLSPQNKLLPYFPSHRDNIFCSFD
jgi:hypothetical protein